MQDRTNTESWITVEWWDGITGTWAELDEARNLGDAQNRVAEAMAEDLSTMEPRRYRIVTTQTITFDTPAV
jgi:hypothetical protein